MADPLHQFQIHDLVPLHLGGVDISFTNSALWMLIAAGVSVAGLTLAMANAKLVPGRFQVFAEDIYSFVANMARENIGHEWHKYFPFVFTLFIVVLMGNMLGLVPYSFTYTSHIAVTAGLAVFVFAWVTLLGFLKHGTHFLHFFCPAGVPVALMPLIIPLEIVSYVTRPLTLSMRLFANMMAGHLVLKVFAGFCVSLMSLSILASVVPMAFNVLMIGFEFLIAFLQAYVFSVLTCIYFRDAIEMH
ncbi:MAG: F0F1 ATP synthase subunit A [Alphaproteobacteria bacterium]|nr:F0F1 ATP synthase subunit A [Alphaproteobacteria bacterium]USO07640.1 MAG: F0F1 ATP synthase subunit A [Rhodospirillales bacterium]